MSDGVDHVSPVSPLKGSHARGCPRAGRCEMLAMEVGGLDITVRGYFADFNQKFYLGMVSHQLVLLRVTLFC